MGLDWLMWIGFFVVIGASLLWLVSDAEKQRTQQEERTTRQLQVVIDSSITTPDFHPSRWFVNRATKAGIAIDQGRRTVCIFSFDTTSSVSQKLLTGTEVLSVDVVDDGQTIVTTTRTNSIGNAALGGLLFGGAGAIVGAASSKSTSTSEERIRSLSLAVLVDDLETPRYQVEFLTRPCTRNSKPYREAVENIQYYHSALEVLIQRPDDTGPSNKQLASSTAVPTPPSTAPAV